MTIQSVTQDPGETLDYALDWSTYLTSVGGDTISSSSWTVTTGLTKVSDSNTTTTTTIWITGGTAGGEYWATNTIVTAGGRTVRYAFRVHVRTKI